MTNGLKLQSHVVESKGREIIENWSCRSQARDNFFRPDDFFERSGLKRLRRSVEGRGILGSLFVKRKYEGLMG